MSQESLQRPDPDLDRLLQEWKVDRPLPPGFHRAVWRRIAGPSRPEPGSPLRALREWVVAQFARPAWSAGCALLLLSGGLAAGYWQATAQTAQWDQLMASRYVQSIDPYFQASHQP